MYVKNLNRSNREAFVLAELGGVVLYDAIENRKVINPNCARSSKSFWNEYAAP